MPDKGHPKGTRAMCSGCKKCQLTHHHPCGEHNAPRSKSVTAKDVAHKVGKQKVVHNAVHAPVDYESFYTNSAYQPQQVETDGKILDALQSGANKFFEATKNKASQVVKKTSASPTKQSDMPHGTQKHQEYTPKEQIILQKACDVLNKHSATLNRAQINALQVLTAIANNTTPTSVRSMQAAKTLPLCTGLLI